jgi:hypothetical protein
MPAERASMRCVREILRLKHACGASDRAIAKSTGLARSTVADYLARAAAAGLAWPLPETLSDTALEAVLFVGTGVAPGTRRKAEPDWPALARELRRPGLTLMLLWQEYRAAAPDGYGYSRFCELYGQWQTRVSPTMRQAHPAGERLFVDYAGQTVDVVDGTTGEVRQARATDRACHRAEAAYALLSGCPRTRTTPPRVLRAACVAPGRSRFRAQAGCCGFGSPSASRSVAARGTHRRRPSASTMLTQPSRCPEEAGALRSKRWPYSGC